MTSNNWGSIQKCASRSDETNWEPHVKITSCVMIQAIENCGSIWPQALACAYLPNHQEFSYKLYLFVFLDTESFCFLRHRTTVKYGHAAAKNSFFLPILSQFQYHAYFAGVFFQKIAQLTKAVFAAEIFTSTASSCLFNVQIGLEIGSQFIGPFSKAMLAFFPASIHLNWITSERNVSG